MTDYSLEFIGRTLVDLREDVRDVRSRVGALERTVGEMKDELTVNTAMYARFQAKWAPVRRPESAQNKS